MTNTNTTTVPANLTDEALREAIKTAYAPRRYELLLTVPAEDRAILTAEAHYLGNMTGGRPSDNLATAIRWGVDRLTSPLAKAMRDAR